MGFYEDKINSQKNVW